MAVLHDAAICPDCGQVGPHNGRFCLNCGPDPLRFGVPPDVQAQLQAGKLEQTCGECGRWSAATHYCSWCFLPMGPADWYRNNDKAQRTARMPKTAPANPPSEYRHSLASWPESWGAYPGEIRGPRAVQTPVKANRAERGATLPVRPAIAA